MRTFTPDLNTILISTLIAMFLHGWWLGRSFILSIRSCTIFILYDVVLVTEETHLNCDEEVMEEGRNPNVSHDFGHEDQDDKKGLLEVEHS